MLAVRHALLGGRFLLEYGSVVGKQRKREPWSKTARESCGI